MKKMTKKFSVALALVLSLALMSVAAFAADIPSPSSTGLPYDVTVTDADGRLDGNIIDNLSTDSEAYKSAEDIFTNGDLMSAVLRDGHTMDELVISKMFDLSLAEEADGPFIITMNIGMSGDKYDAYVMHYINGAWTYVEDSSLASDGTLTFTVDSLSPFAVLTAEKTSSTGSGTTGGTNGGGTTGSGTTGSGTTGSGTTGSGTNGGTGSSPQTGDSVTPIVAVAAVVVIGLGLGGAFTTVALKRKAD